MISWALPDYYLLIQFINTAGHLGLNSLLSDLLLFRQNRAEEVFGGSFTFMFIVIILHAYEWGLQNFGLCRLDDLERTLTALCRVLKRAGLFELRVSWLGFENWLLFREWDSICALQNNRLSESGLEFFEAIPFVHSDDA